MSYAEVAVNAPVRNPRTFSYRVPQGLVVKVGQAVWVPFGPRTLQGIVCALGGVPQFENTRDILSLIDDRPLLAPWQVELARWIADYYFSPVFAAVALMLPPGFERKLLAFVQCAESVVPESLASLPPEQGVVIERVRSEGHAAVKSLEREFGLKKTRAALQALVHKGLLVRSDSLERERVRVKRVKMVALNVAPEVARQAMESWCGDRKLHSRIALVELLLMEGPLTAVEIKSKLGRPALSLASLEKSGLVKVLEKEVRRDPLEAYRTETSAPPALTPAQQAVWEKLASAFEKGLPLSQRGTQGDSPPAYLLHGVTGSGKTEIYLRAAAGAIAAGKKAVVLVPEIALTPQTISRFLSRFPGGVAVLHSKLSLGEQYDEWWRIRRGECDVVIGSRSAVFSPQPDLGLVVIDEEHEWTYKQKEGQPFYHARDVALKIAELTGAMVLMGSATPDVSSYFMAREGSYGLLELPERVSAGGGAVTLPGVEVVDMRKEFAEGSRGLFSRSLVREVRQALHEGGQVILFLNRRGSNTFIQCRDCGHVLRCRKCEVSLVYHRDQDRLVCHQCNYRTAMPEECPECGSKKIKYLGSGTQRVEEEASWNFEGARLLRWDRDVTTERHSHERILEKFVSRQADILIGTQMIAKGLDIPAVTLVGIVNADVGLFLPDFRAAERTFQIITQVAGRAGRGPKGGRVIIQTYNPRHYSIVAASGHDYRAFYQKEMGYRREFNYPPFRSLISLSYRHPNENACKREAERVAGVITAEAGRGFVDVDLLGPAPAPIARKRGRYEWQLLLRGKDCHLVLSAMTLPPGWAVDVDPLGV
ncbi:MAG: primosomal protein N' [Chloroflexi bacterium]|nr:primosomal protein N' [Chloroflexota bacterium]